MTNWIVVLALAALIPATIVSRKTPSRRVESFLTYYVFGLLLLVVAIPVAIWVAKDERVRRCPVCAETIRVEATVCPHCNRDLEAVPA